ncbi:MAG TPA: hypothetical protein DCL41_00370 [Bdellovibrionales bacterium]|nr:hypothetical protein [Pseudobdellovibrionaceae bacterium]HAG90292.1 hypothetical protein [Bdellovibrionales bacterium]
MKKYSTILSVLVAALSVIFMGCATNKHKAKEIETEMDKGQKLGEETVGVKDGNMVIQKKLEMNEALRRLQNEVYELEDRVYGNRKYGSKGLYGALKDCKAEAVSRALGGDGKLRWTEPVDRVTEKEDEWNIGYDEKDKLVAVSEEFLVDRIERFKKYRQTLMKRQDEYEDKLEVCDAEVKAKKEKTASDSSDE